VIAATGSRWSAVADGWPGWMWRLIVSSAILALYLICLSWLFSGVR
jgi:hypothetical protein